MNRLTINVHIQLHTLTLHTTHTILLTLHTLTATHTHTTHYTTHTTHSHSYTHSHYTLHTTHTTHSHSYTHSHYTTHTTHSHSYTHSHYTLHYSHYTLSQLHTLTATHTHTTHTTLLTLHTLTATHTHCSCFVMAWPFRLSTLKLLVRVGKMRKATTVVLLLLDFRKWLSLASDSRNRSAPLLLNSYLVGNSHKGVNRKVTDSQFLSSRLHVHVNER